MPTPPLLGQFIGRNNCSIEVIASELLNCPEIKHSYLAFLQHSGFVCQDPGQRSSRTAYYSSEGRRNPYQKLQVR